MSQFHMPLSQPHLEGSWARVSYSFCFGFGGSEGADVACWRAMVRRLLSLNHRARTFQHSSYITLPPAPPPHSPHPLDVITLPQCNSVPLAGVESFHAGSRKNPFYASNLSLHSHNFSTRWRSTTTLTVALKYSGCLQ